MLAIPERESTSFFSNSRFVKELTSKDFDETELWKLKKNKCCIILFYAPWCPYCKAVKDVWNDLGEKAIFYRVYAMNCQKEQVWVNKVKEDLPSLIPHYEVFN